MTPENIRGWQTERLVLGLQTVESILSVTAEAAMRHYRDGGTGWTALEVLGHLFDFEEVLWERARLTVEADRPALPFPDPDALVIANRHNATDWHALFADWRMRREGFLAFLRARAATDWERIGIHPNRGPMTLEDQLFLCSLHDSIHIEQMTRVLAQRQEPARG
jgi:hypothetical protein